MHCMTAVSLEMSDEPYKKGHRGVKSLTKSQCKPIDLTPMAPYAL